MDNYAIEYRKDDKSVKKKSSSRELKENNRSYIYIYSLRDKCLKATFTCS